MSELLNCGGKIGQISINRLKEQRKTIVEKWSELGFLEGLKGEVKPNIAQLYEGQASALLNETIITVDDKWKFDNF